MERDSKGRFKKAKKIDDYAETLRFRNGNELVIRIPFSEYMPFFLLLMCFFIIGYPWFLIIRPLARKLLKLMGKAAIISAKTKTNVTITPDDWD